VRYLGLMAALLVGCAAVANALVFCNAGITGSVPTLSPSSTAESIADLTLSCSSPPGQSGVVSGNFAFSLNSTILNTGAWSLIQGANTYAGTLAAANQIIFTGVSYDLSQPAFSFQLQGVQVNPSTSVPGTQYYEITSASAATGLLMNQPNQGVLVAQNGQPTLVALHNFATPPKGANPHAGLIRDPAGNFYGTTEGGGASGAGTVFKLSPAGKETVLYSFTGGADGNDPVAGVIRDSAGNLYGTTQFGGTGAGVVYQLDPSGHETVMYTFTGGPDGGQPTAGVIRDSATGSLYGTTEFGGAGNGVIYRLDSSGNERALYIFTVLHMFTGGADGGQPNAGVIRDSAGNLFGTTSSGGTGAGVVFQLDSTNNEKVLYTFSGGADGGKPYAGVVQDSVGNLYGTTNSGGSGAGVVFKVDKTHHETALYTFTGGADGGLPFAGVIRDSAGNMYGTTTFDGQGAGVVFKLDTTGHETVLYSFTNETDGGYPYGGVIRDSAGNLYGTTVSGPFNAGAVFKVDTTAHETVMYTFPSGTDGDFPVAGVVRDSAGNLYGTTLYGGPAGRGVVFKVDPTGQESVLYSFSGGADGGYPNGGVVLDSSGNLYGTASSGVGNAGVVFKLDTTGHETVLYSFTGGADGGNPQAGVIFDLAGNIYGTTYNGGTSGHGVVFKLDTAGHETALYSFTGGADGGNPWAGVIRDASGGDLYGTTLFGGSSDCPNGCGVVFKVGPGGHETVLYTFTGGADGGTPYAGVIRDSAGNLIGTTRGGGAAPGLGVMYQVDTKGNETVLYSFTGGMDGAAPEGGVIRDSAGNLYGTTVGGGAFGRGVVYELDTTGNETVLYSFSGGADGGNPTAGVVRGPAGDLYGTAQIGGKHGGGVVFRLEAH
jgi:uncharacterized repeat protein (TIGR03803 family)